jgi:cytochrome c oxidase assembly factor CtaG
VALAIALVSPLDAMSEQLLSVHMVQHLVLVIVAAPLLVVGSPALVFGQAIPAAWRRRVHRLSRMRGPRATGRMLTQPLVIWLLAAAVLWVWHAPVLYQAALEHPLVHVVEHAAFLGSAMLFWWTALQPSGPRRLPRGADVLFIVTGALQSGALGALLAFAAQPIYPFYLHRTAAWGMTPLQDQQLAGLLMWVPPFVIYLVAAGALFVTWLRTAELEARRAEARADRRLVELHRR